MLLNIFEAKKYVILCSFLLFSFICFIQVGRVSNPFGGILASIVVFGSQLLALTEDGGRILIWDTAGGGTRDSCSHQYDGPTNVSC